MHHFSNSCSPLRYPNASAPNWQPRCRNATSAKRCWNSRRRLDRLGFGEVRWAITGAAPTPPAVVAFFVTLGLPLCEGLGMSEASSLVAVNTPGRLRAGSVGRALDSVEVATAADGELLVRGTQIMRGYRDQPARTREALDTQGWLHTGDIARIDDDGFVWIVDRKKELIITAAGKNLSPANIEMAVRSAGNLIAHVCAIGEARPYVVALVCLDPAAVGDRAFDDPALTQEVQEQIDRANTTLARSTRTANGPRVDRAGSAGGRVTDGGRRRVAVYASWRPSGLAVRCPTASPQCEMMSQWRTVELFPGNRAGRGHRSPSSLRRVPECPAMSPSKPANPKLVQPCGLTTGSRFCAIWAMKLCMARSTRSRSPESIRSSIRPRICAVSTVANSSAHRALIANLRANSSRSGSVMSMVNDCPMSSRLSGAARPLRAVISNSNRNCRASSVALN
ncbi:AMP-binding protein [Nocardia nova]|nr:AMP-binding protein [Nocardia nova]